jgi:hypothetical protein
MAAVVGVGLGRLLTMEDGKATDEDKAFYRAWLSRIEGGLRPSAIDRSHA